MERDMTSQSLTASVKELSAVDGMVQLSFLIQSTLAFRAEEQGLSLIQTRLLGILRDRMPSVNELAKMLGLDKSSASGLLSRAELRGLVERIPSEVDRRVVVIRITALGRLLGSKIAVEVESDVSRILAALSLKDAAAFAKITSRLLIAHGDAHGVDLFAGVIADPKGRS
jgi:DNA-binding MarR family transcriptional regulator